MKAEHNDVDAGLALRPHQVVAKSLDKTCALLSVVGALVILGIMVITVLDVARRSLQGGGVPGAIELAEAFLPAGIFLGFAHAYREGAHVAITAFTDRMPRGAARWVELIGAGVTLALLGWMAYETTILALNSYTHGEYRFGLLNVHLWPTRTAIAIGLILTSLQVLRKMTQILFLYDREDLAIDGANK